MSCTDPGPTKVFPVLKLVFFPLHVSGLETADLPASPRRERALPAPEKMLPT